MTENKTIAIVDYGLGNLYSVTKAFSRFTPACVVTEDPDVVEGAGALVIPGVGAFGAGIHGLEVRNLTKSIQRFAESGRPLLGICLGAQLLLSQGYEFGAHQGLNILRGKVERFPDLPPHVKIPHIGWNSIRRGTKVSWDGTILEGTLEGSMMYFVHSYLLYPEDEDAVFTTTTYGGLTFCSGVRKGNVYGFQFHPEKSGEAGLALIKEFVGLVH